MDAIVTTSLTRRFGEFTAVEDVNLSVAPGQFYGFLGPNGAGKSTTIKMLTGLLAPTEGSMQILGLDVATHLVDVKRQIGVVPEGMALFGRLTGSEKLAMAAAVIHGPKVLFLDEPFEGVDAVASGTLKAMLQRMIARGATIFLTSHVLEIVERLCSHVGIINKGRLVAQGSLDELRSGVGGAEGKMSLEELFLQTVGGPRNAVQELSWLG
ncbi:MAG: multidrug ABC transporter ATP-binding protein [Acidobacteria bacterium]|nr:MAG: multidrug ABC transporter ATP-binding protein [Acidobacteriota bacterium]